MIAAMKFRMRMGFLGVLVSLSVWGWLGLFSSGCYLDPFRLKRLRPGVLRLCPIVRRQFRRLLLINSEKVLDWLHRRSGNFELCFDCAWGEAVDALESAPEGCIGPVAERFGDPRDALCR